MRCFDDSLMRLLGGAVGQCVRSW